MPKEAQMIVQGVMLVGSCVCIYGGVRVIATIADIGRRAWRHFVHKDPDAW